MSYKTVWPARTWVRGAEGLEPEQADKSTLPCSPPYLSPCNNPEVRKCAG